MHQIRDKLLALFIYLFIHSFCFLGTHPWHMEVPRLGVKSELQLPAYATATAIQDPSFICNLTTAHGNTRSLTQLVRPGIQPTSSWILVRFVSLGPRELLTCILLMAFWKNVDNFFPQACLSQDSILTNSTA